MTDLIIRNPDAVLREEDEHGGLIFNPDTNQIRVLNATGLVVWELCNGSLTGDQIAAALGQRFDATPDTDVTADVTQFLELLQRDGFVGVVEAEPTP